MSTIRITVEDTILEAEVDSSDTAQQVLGALPLEAVVNVWGDEIYFEIPVTLSESADVRSEVEIGTLAYWPPGQAFCVFYGPTPVSTDSAPRAYSPVNLFGRVKGDATVLRGVKSGSKVRVEIA